MIYPRSSPRAGKSRLLALPLLLMLLLLLLLLLLALLLLLLLTARPFIPLNPALLSGDEARRSDSRAQQELAAPARDVL